MKKMPATRKPAEMAALTRPARSHPRCMLMAALKNQAAAPTYQIQLKLRPTFLRCARLAGRFSLAFIVIRCGGRGQGAAIGDQRSEKRMRSRAIPHLPKPGQKWGTPAAHPLKPTPGLNGPPANSLPPTPCSSAVLPSLFPWVRVRTGSELRAFGQGQPYAGRGPGSWPSGTQTLRAGTHSASL